MKFNHWFYTKSAWVESKKKNHDCLVISAFNRFPYSVLKQSDAAHCTKTPQCPLQLLETNFQEQSRKGKMIDKKNLVVFA